LPGVEALEQEIERHDLGERGRMDARMGLLAEAVAPELPSTMMEENCRVGSFRVPLMVFGGGPPHDDAWKGAHRPESF